MQTSKVAFGCVSKFSI